jgi:hypothetical protein
MVETQSTGKLGPWGPGMGVGRVWGKSWGQKEEVPRVIVHSTYLSIQCLAWLGGGTDL